MPLSYDEIVDRFDLSLLREPADLVVEGGDIAVARHRDLRFGSIGFQGLMRLVQEWRFSEQPLRHLFTAAYYEVQQTSSVKDCEADLSSFADFQRVREHMMAHQVMAQEIHAMKFASQTFAGCVIMVLSGLIQQFRDDIRDAGVSENADPRYGGRSFGQIVVAAANGFRHADEWFKTNAPTPQQRQSMETLKDAGIGTASAEVRNIALKTLDIISESGNFDHMSSSMFAFAHTLAQRAHKKG